MFNEKKFIERVRAVNAGAYSPNSDEIATLRTANEADALGLLLDAFRLGFMKGQRAEHKKHIKRRPAKYASDTECKTHLLHNAIDRNKDNEKYIYWMFLHSRALDGTLDLIDKSKENIEQKEAGAG